MIYRKLSTVELYKLHNQQAEIHPKLDIKVLLDNVRSGLNVGSVFRTSDGFGIDEIILGGYTVQPPHKEILKTAIGATESVKWSHYENLFEKVLELKTQGYLILAIEQTTNSTILSDFIFSKGTKYALIFGNEVSGVSDEILEICEGSIEIPQSGIKHSLNISVCTGIVLWEAFKQMVKVN